MKEYYDQLSFFFLIQRWIRAVTMRNSRPVRQRALNSLKSLSFPNSAFTSSWGIRCSHRTTSYFNHDLNLTHLRKATHANIWLSLAGCSARPHSSKDLVEQCVEPPWPGQRLQFSAASQALWNELCSTPECKHPLVKYVSGEAANYTTGDPRFTIHRFTTPPRGYSFTRSLPSYCGLRYMNVFF